MQINTYIDACVCVYDPDYKDLFNLSISTSSTFTLFTACSEKKNTPLRPQVSRKRILKINHWQNVSVVSAGG